LKEQYYIKKWKGKTKAFLFRFHQNLTSLFSDDHEGKDDHSKEFEHKRKLFGHGQRRTFSSSENITPDNSKAKECKDTGSEYRRNIHGTKQWTESKCKDKKTSDCSIRTFEVDVKINTGKL